MAIKFSYELVGVGWCLCHIKTEQGACELGGSYLSNILFDFYSAVINLIQGSALESVIFPKEPGEYVWLITKVSEEDINIKITKHKKSPYFRSFDESGEIVFEQVVNLREFAKAFWNSYGRFNLDLGLGWVQEKMVCPLFSFRQIRRP